MQNITGQRNKLVPTFPSSKNMQLKSWKELKKEDYELEYDDGFPSDSDSDAQMFVVLSCNWDHSVLSVQQ